MNNIKIKTYSQRKKPTALTERNEVFQDHKDKSSIDEVNKLIKTPSLNISSKLDSMGNRSININFFKGKQNK